jgi:hypothetical protein
VKVKKLGKKIQYDWFPQFRRRQPSNVFMVYLQSIFLWQPAMASYKQWHGMHEKAKIVIQKMKMNTPRSISENIPF